jgi:glycosyltransferase involved in cell wall biosynthesis
MSKAKVCMLTTDHSALDDRIFYKESKSLQQTSYDVTLLVPLNDKGFLVDMGGNRIADSKTAIQNIKIIGFNKPRSHFGRIHSIIQLINLTSAGKLDIRGKNYADLINKGVELNADIYHCHEIDSIYAGTQIKKKLQKKGRNPKLIYDVHEFHPAVSYDVKNLGNKVYNKILRKIIVHFEKEALKYVDYVITANQITRGYLLTLNRFIQTEVIYNCPILSIFKEPKKKKEHKDKVVICHEGFLLFRRGLKQIIEITRELKKRYDDEVELLIIGDAFGKEKEYFKQKIEEYTLHSTIKCTGWLPYEKVGDALLQVDIGVIFFEPTENNMLAGPPHKLFNYMRYGVPVVSVDLPETSRIISDAKCGLILKDWNLNSMVTALSTLIDDENKRRRLGENAKKAVYNHYNWTEMEKKLLRIYREIIEDKKYVSE